MSTIAWNSESIPPYVRQRQRGVKVSTNSTRLLGFNCLVMYYSRNKNIRVYSPRKESPKCELVWTRRFSLSLITFHAQTHMHTHSRFVVIGSFAPILTRIGYTIDWKQVIVITWGGLRGAVGLALALVVVQTPGVPLDTIGSKVFM